MRQGDAGENTAETVSGSRRIAHTRARAPIAAPVLKSEEVIERVLTAVSEGTPLAKVLREDWAPHRSSWYQWLNNDPELDHRFEQARQDGYDLISARIQDITRGGEGSSGDVKRDRLIAEYDLKLLEKWDRRYGLRIQNAQTDAEGNDVELPKSQKERLALLMEILERARASKEAQEQWEAEHRRQFEARHGPIVEARALPPPADPADDASDLV